MSKAESRLVRAFSALSGIDWLLVGFMGWERWKIFGGEEVAKVTTREVHDKNLLAFDKGICEFFDARGPNNIFNQP